ncbi:MAG TPA: FG-GAP-like repeat-containing protein, partial [bacterium]
MLRSLARISAISPLIFYVLLTTHLFSDDAKLADQSAFEWRAISFPFDDRIWQAVLFDSANGWASSGSLSDGRLYRLLNGDWQFVPPQNNIYISKVLGLSPDNIWFVCYDKSSYRYILRHDDRGNIADFYTPNADPIAQLDFLAPDNIWAVCQWGQIMRFDGTGWELVPSPTFAHIASISMANDSCGWAGGKYRNLGFLLHWDGKQWQIKMQQKKFVPKVMMVNDTLGWGFMDFDSCLIRLTHDRWDLVTLASITQDTIVANWQDVARPIFFNNSGIVTFGGGTSTVTYANRQRDILWFTASPEKPQAKIYLLTHDGKVNYVRRQLPTTPKLFWQYVGRAFEGATQEYGVAIGDIDSDGDDDIYSVNTSAENHLQLFGGNSQIKSVQSKEFTDAAGHLNIIGTPKSKEGLVIYDMGVTFADMDNDGDRDIYITSMYEENMLYENIRGRTFKDIAAQAGVDGAGTRSQVGIWGDVDNDGDVDLFVTNEDTTNMLFLNNGIGKFKEITHQAGLTTTRSG